MGLSDFDEARAKPQAGVDRRLAGELVGDGGDPGAEAAGPGVERAVALDADEPLAVGGGEVDGLEQLDFERVARRRASGPWRFRCAAGAGRGAGRSTAARRAARDRPTRRGRRGGRRFAARSSPALAAKRSAPVSRQRELALPRAAELPRGEVDELAELRGELVEVELRARLRGRRRRRRR